MADDKVTDQGRKEGRAGKDGGESSGVVTGSAGFKGTHSSFSLLLLLLPSQSVSGCGVGACLAFIFEP
ncbi:uncharacterized protein CIMG_13566 [Coccidioides immitis RS]|uniref:Uncharacterized protein n=1 Tax=Coccidioides immitis (strain RS) TaxID=246410 RepID=A0A0D8JYG6_COCIM|nr:uncharacterized protein CIMG_13566 [Coccidioides immitis RS]KJF61298.1 hypothetical protein CIMG_13566 [Coccidioides immitis RS]